MTSLGEVYAEARRDNLRRLYLGTGLFVAGALMVVVAILVATTDLLTGALGVYGAREVAGVVAGLGVPAVFVGIFTVLPASTRERAAAAIGASIAALGVVLFWAVYPEQWAGASPTDHTLLVSTIYFFGAITTFWSLFTAIVNFKTRNDPGGTVTIERTVEGETQVIEVPASEVDTDDLARGGDGGLGGIGVVGSVDRDGVMADDPPDEGVEVSTAGSGGSAPASDGGTAAERPRSPGKAGERGGATGGGGEANPDVYCGNCHHFEYVEGDGDIRPYCAFHDALMDDMEPCDSWEPNTP